jgi:hypothetical protein
MFFEARFQLVEKELFAEQVQPVPRNSAKNGMHRPRGTFAIRGIKKRPQKGHQKDEPAPPEALGKRLRIPGKERHRLDHGEVKQTALYPPVDGWGRTGIVVRRFQDCGSFPFTSRFHRLG